MTESLRGLQEGGEPASHVPRMPQAILSDAKFLVNISSPCQYIVDMPQHTPSLVPFVWPPNVPEDHGLYITSQIQDWQINHGSLLKNISSSSAYSSICYPIGLSVFPTPFPKAQYDHARRLQYIYNKLYCTIAEDEQWIFEVIKDLIPVHPLAAALWDIHERVKSSGGYVQNISAGIFRSDYMLHTISGSKDLELKQVEFNTFSCAGASHANKATNMHHHLARTGVYDLQAAAYQITNSNLPPNNNIESLAACLAEAHAAYGPPRCRDATQTAVLFIIQPRNFNIADERPIEYALWDRDSPVPAYRVDFAEDVLQYTSLTETRELLYHPPWRGQQSPVEISVVYMRAGYEAHEYHAKGKEARLRLEMSRAIKCPSLMAHIMTFKKVQQSLTAPHVLERFLSAEEADVIRSTFVEIYPMDESERGMQARRLATNRKTASNYILKPSLEGGGNNVYGDAIPEYLASIPQQTWSAFVLMEKIASPKVENVLMSSRGVDIGEVVSELGILGGCLWRRGKDGCEMLQNSVAGWSFKTKYEDVKEMSVVKGYGCFDTPLLFE